MVNMTELKDIFKDELARAEFHVERATPATMITTNQRGSYREHLKEASVLLCNARSTLRKIKNHADPAQRLTSDDLRGLQEQFDVICGNYDDVNKEVNQEDDEVDSTPGRQRDQLSLTRTTEDTSHTREQSKAAHQTKMKMDHLDVDVTNLSTNIMKYMPPSTLEDFLIVKAMKLRSEWETQATGITKKLIEVQSAISQWGLTELEDEANTLKSKISYNGQQLSTTISQVEQLDASRGLFSDRPTKACPTKLPTFGGP